MLTLAGHVAGSNALTPPNLLSFPDNVTTSAQGTLVLVGLRGTVKEVLEIAGLTNVFPVYARESDMIAARPDWR